MKDIPGYEGLYAITTEGGVWSYVKNKWLKPSVIRNYKRVTLRKDNKVKIYFIHRLVVMTYISEIPKGMVVNHIDQNKANNCIDNLEICTPSENIRHGDCIQRRVKTVLKRWKLNPKKGVKGKTLSAETKQKISAAKKGCIPWNKGKKKGIDY